VVRYSVGGKMSIADINIYTMVSSLKKGFLDGIDKTIADKYPTLISIFETVGKNEQVAAWIEAHKKK